MVFYSEGEVFLFPFPFPSWIFFPAHAPSCPSAPVLQLFVRACITPRGPGLTVSYYPAPWLCFDYHHSANHYRIIHVNGGYVFDDGFWALVSTPYLVLCYSSCIGTTPAASDARWGVVCHCVCECCRYPLPVKDNEEQWVIELSLNKKNRVSL